MSPSPVMRVSPGRELKFENHKRGRSLESAILYREKEDDLALFNEVGNKERDGFLLQSNENVDDFFCKFFHPYYMLVDSLKVLCIFYLQFALFIILWRWQRQS